MLIKNIHQLIGQTPLIELQIPVPNQSRILQNWRCSILVVALKTV